jgi:hypothetical protein
MNKNIPSHSLPPPVNDSLSQNDDNNKNSIKAGKEEKGKSDDQF